MRWMHGSAVVLTVLAAGGLITACGTAKAPDGVQPSAVSAAKACKLPVNKVAPVPGQELAGPAVTDLTGGAAARGFSLDGGKFSIAPPARDVPRVSRVQAECEEQAAVGVNGFPASLTGLGSGLAIGYGLVTVSSRLPVNPWNGYYPQMTAPTPAAASYRGRLAWVVVFRHELVASCPASTSTTPPPAQPAYKGYYYNVFIVDAATGRDALIYSEAVPFPCNGYGITPPSLTIPVELTSVPWKLDSRAADGFWGTATAYVPSCDQYDSEARVIQGTDVVRVLAYGQVGRNCGPPRPVTVYVQAATVFQRLPRTLVHAPTGLYITDPGTQASPDPATVDKIVTVGPANAGQTITVHVGDVIAPVAFPGDPQRSPLVHSGNPAVLGLLGPPQLQNGFSEFRAWRPGRATLSASYQGWTVHIVVLAR